MSAGTIINVLANIPWGQVVDNAPKVADGAARLWKAVRRKTTDGAADASTMAGAAQTEAEALESRLKAMEAQLLRLEEQLDSSAELIQALAEQNTQLVLKIEQNSARLFRLAVATAMGGVALLGLVGYLLLRP